MTPETYLGAARAERFVNGPLRPGLRQFRLDAETVDALPLDHLAYRGTWRLSDDDATAVANARLDLAFRARKVFLVLGSPGRARTVRVRVDGRRERDVRVDSHRLYTLADVGRFGSHRLSLRFEPGLQVYAFTFG